MGGVAVHLLWGELGFAPFYAYVVFRQLHELDVHSGLRSRLAHHIPFLAPNEHHDLHHLRPHAGNYASMLTVWDRVLGTEASMSHTAEGRTTREVAGLRAAK